MSTDQWLQELADVLPHFEAGIDNIEAIDRVTFLLERDAGFWTLAEQEEITRAISNALGLDVYTKFS